MNNMERRHPQTGFTTSYYRLAILEAASAAPPRMALQISIKSQFRKIVSTFGDK